MKDPHIRLFVSLLLLCLITLHESSEGSVKKTNSIEFKKDNTAGNISQAEKIQNILDVLRKESVVIQSLKDVVMSLKADQQKGTTKPSLKRKRPASHGPKRKSTPTVKNNAIISTPTSAKTVPGSMPGPDAQNEPTASVSPASETTTATTNKPVTTPSKSATAQAEKIQNILDVLRKQSAIIQSLNDAVRSLKADQQKGTTKPSFKRKGPASHGPKSKSTPTVKLNNAIISTPTPAKTGSMPGPDTQNEPTASVSPASETTTATTRKPVTTPSKSATGDSTTSHITSPNIDRITTQSEAGNSSKSSTNEPTTTQKSTVSRTMRTTDKKPGLPTTFSPTQPKRLKPPKTSTSRTTPKMKTSAKNDSEVPTNSSAGEQPLSSTTKETPIPKNDGSSDDKNNTKQSESTSDDSSFLRQVNRFPALFMAALFFIVLIYFGYHNRNTIHKFVKTGYSGSKQGAKGYVKVKLDDVIDLPRDANRQYIY